MNMFKKKSRAKVFKNIYIFENCISSYNYNSCWYNIHVIVILKQPNNNKQLISYPVLN